ncbi:hypothetical protein DdX_14318 [Ditylenchus destructor]|uniref:Uncharacterized protein n=1 Tax=Ditylenchus destructor TaxID=166010 RepID=A0AAD4MRA9_9BILA|nr:hypothetical protein DdX_14318 [Ditylenchus destructor]
MPLFLNGDLLLEVAKYWELVKSENKSTLIDVRYTGAGSSLSSIKREKTDTNDASAPDDNTETENFLIEIYAKIHTRKDKGKLSFTVSKRSVITVGIAVKAAAFLAKLKEARVTSTIPEEAMLEALATDIEQMAAFAHVMGGQEILHNQSWPMMRNFIGISL